MTAPSWKRPWLGEVVAGALAALACLPVLSWPFANDQSIFATIAREMTEGAVLYRDVWEHKPPGVFVSYALAFLLIHPDLWAVHVLEILAVGLAAAALFRAARERLDSAAAGAVAAAALPLLYLPWRGNAAQPEMFTLPFVAWAFALWPRPGDARPPEARCFWSGVLLSGAMLYKTPLLFFPAAALADRLILDCRRPGWTEKLRPTAAVAAGVAALPLLVFLYYCARGGFAEFMDANLHFPSKYAAPSLGGKSLGDHLEAVRWMAWLVPPAGVGLMALGIGRGLFVRRAETLRWVAFGVAGWAGVVLQAKYWPYHHLIMLAGVAAAFGLAFAKDPADMPGASPRRRMANRVALAAAGLLAVLTAAGYLPEAGKEWSSFNGAATRDLEDDRPGTGSAEERDVARAIRERTAPGERIFVWGDQPVLYVLSDRRLAGPVPHLLPVLAWFLGRDESKTRLDRLLERLGRERPRWIIVTPGKLWWYGAHEPREIIPEYPNLKRFLEDCYALAERRGDYEFWKLRE